MTNNRSLALPVILAVLIFAAAIVSAVTEYRASDAISAASVALLLAGVAFGVLAQRLYEMEKEMDTLKKAVSNQANVEQPQDDGENYDGK